MRRIIGIAVAAAVLAPQVARGESPGSVRARAEIGGSFGASGAAVAGLAVRATGAWQSFVLEGSLDVGGYVDGAPRSYDLSLLAGAGASFPLGARWTGSALALYGMHALGVDEPGGGEGFQDHALPAAGVRFTATWEHPTAVKELSLAITLGATLTADLRREYDVFLQEDVGGYTALVSATVGFGLGR